MKSIWYLVFGLLFLSSPLHARESFFPSAFLVEPSAHTTWRSLGFDKMLLQHILLALKGDMFRQRPPEWTYYFDSETFEDESILCLGNADLWRLVAIRIVPLANPPSEMQPELRLSFQPFCSDSDVAADTSIQLALSSKDKAWSIDLFEFSKTAVRNTALPLSALENAGFISRSELEQFKDMPPVLDADLALEKVIQLKNSGFEVSSVKWMASHPGQLDWIFGHLKKSSSTQRMQALPVVLKSREGGEILSLGLFDFLPLPLREAYKNLDFKIQTQLNTFHVIEDPHSSRAAALRVLEVDLRVSDPKQTHHEQASCIQCHSAQERMVETMRYLNHGGAKEFGYFFRGLGYIEDQPYVSWRTVQESRHLNEQLQNYLNEAAPPL